MIFLGVLKQRDGFCFIFILQEKGRRFRSFLGVWRDYFQEYEIKRDVGKGKGEMWLDFRESFNV